LNRVMRVFGTKYDFETMTPVVCLAMMFIEAMSRADLNSRQRQDVGARPPRGGLAPTGGLSGVCA
jgi:hypothetical protein